MLTSAIHPLLNLEWDVVQRTCCTVNVDDMQIASACYPPLAGGKWMTRFGLEMVASLGCQGENDAALLENILEFSDMQIVRMCVVAVRKFSSAN